MRSKSSKALASLTWQKRKLKESRVDDEISRLKAEISRLEMENKILRDNQLGGTE